MKNSKRIVKVSKKATGLKKVVAMLLCGMVNVSPKILYGIVVMATCSLMALIFLGCMGLRW